ncbi:PREDICTED: BRCA1-A complex subunit Abraxas [Cyprinodon variegatus]|uniref:BRCA1-A complex subunit Abraxas n=1 Tax=Cyprinodon variegatus TaxID=28743 RepID=UPI0007429245|nr:PREDICTED: BRCA1-A complex subunit Abraxas [Cyprinodon variegatus]
MSEPNVRISGTVLASLMFQHVNSDSDVVLVLTGSDCSFDVQDSVVGWYRQRRNSEQHMTFREKLVHEKLKAVLQNPHMIFFLLTSSRVTQTDSTHRMEYSAFTSCSRRFMSVPVLVTNLGLLEQQGYWKASVPCSASGYSLTMKKHRPKFFSPIGLLREVEEINKMNESLQEELQKVCAEVEESERSVKELQLEVSALRRRLRARQQGSAGGGAEEQQSLAGGDAQPRRNQLLLEAVRALLGSAPLFLTQTLDLQAVPVPDKTASPQNAEDTEQEESRGKRQREELQGRGRKRRRSSSPS